MTAERDRGLDEIAVRPGLPTLLKKGRQVSQELLAREPREPRIVEHDQIVSAGPRFKIYQFFLKKICIRKLGDVDMDVGLCFVIVRCLFERLAFDSGDNSKDELFSKRLRVRMTGAECQQQDERQGDR